MVTLLDLAFHYGSEEDKRAADLLQRRLLHDDSKDCGVLNRIVGCMKDFKKHDRKIAKQARRETREYATDMVKTMHIVLRVYERLSKSHFSVKKRTRYHSTAADPQRKAAQRKQKRQGGDGSDDEEGEEGDAAAAGSDDDTPAATDGPSEEKPRDSAEADRNKGAEVRLPLPRHARCSEPATGRLRTALMYSRLC